MGWFDNIAAAIAQAASSAATALTTAAPALAQAAAPSSVGGGGGDPDKDAATLAAEYGFSKAFFSKDPELSRLIRRAVSEQWEIAEFQAHFMDTKWYRSNSASVRQWIELETRDPNEAKAKIGARAAEFADTLSQFGVTKLSPDEISVLAKKSLKYGWNQTQITDTLAGYVDFRPGQMSGTPAALEMQINQMLGDYGITASGKQVGGWIRGVLTERMTEDNLRDTFRDMAKSKYVGMAPYLDKGMTVRDVAAPYIQRYAELLEVGGEAVDLRDNLIQTALQGVSSGDGKPPQMQTLYEFERAVKRDSRWLQTKNAQNDLMNAASGILRDWGMIG